VTAVAFTAERTAMWILICVTRCALAIGIMKRCRCVTLLTGDIGMRADQGESRDVMIEHELRNPTRRNVAGFAALPDLTKVYIIVDMAAATRGRQRLIKPTGVAALARQVVVTWRKLDTGLPLVVEAHGDPAENAVTAATIAAEATLVNVIAKMAGTTLAVARIAEI